MLKVTPVEWVIPLPVAVIVNEKVPTGEFLLVEMVSVEFPEPVTDEGLNVPLVREGKPLTLNVAAEEKDPIATTVIVNLAEDFRLTVALVGEAVSEKSAATVTTRLTCVVCLRPPLVAVIVSG